MKNNLKIWREEKDITQDELAKKIGVSRQTINSIEREKYDPSLKLAFKLADFFDCNIRDMFSSQEEYQELMERNQIMIVDDEPDVRKLVKTILMQENNLITEAEDGEEALEKLKKEKPDLILLDINMPKLDGWETLDEMSKRSYTEKIPVTMVTVEKLTFMKMLRKDLENLVGYIEKPFTRTELIDTVNTLIDRTRKINRLKKKIIEHSDDGKDLAKAFLAWNQKKMIHERILEKLEETEEKTSDKKKLNRIENFKKGERRAIQEAEHKRSEILKLTELVA